MGCVMTQSITHQRFAKKWLKEVQYQHFISPIVLQGANWRAGEIIGE
jgi:hypothetical protein